MKQEKRHIDLSTMVYGKVPPQAKDLEEAVLGAIMLQKDAFDIVAEIMRPECFYIDAHQKIFRAMGNLQKANQPIDILTVVEQLKKSEELEIIGGPFAITRLTNSVVSAANIEAHARIIIQKFLARELIRIGGLSLTVGYEDGADVFDSISEVEKELTALASGNQESYTSVSTELVKALTRIADLRKAGKHVTGVHTGYPELDRITHGWQPSDLIILAARPSVGKTAFALNLARNAAMHPENPVPVAFFSLEMSKGQLAQRLLSAESEVYLDRVMTGQVYDDEFQKLHDASARIADHKLFFDDTPALNVFQLRSKIRTLKRKHNVGLVIIDYLQLMSGVNERGQNREQEISTISRNLKSLAKEINIPIIALSQLSRKVEDRKEGNKIPQLSDLRESGAIEQDADVVMFLYRPEYHDITQNEMGESTKGETDLRIGKHRAGSLDNVKFTAQLHYQKFVPFQGQAVTAPPAGNWRPVSEAQNDLF